MSKKTKKKKIDSEKNTVIKQPNNDNMNIVWAFDKIDRDGLFAFDPSREDFNHREIIDKLISYSSLTWGEIKRQTHDGGKSKHHYLDSSSLSKEAANRLSQLHLEEESDCVFSMALQNKLRLIGLVHGDKFHVIWYDPEHKVCPSKKKHT